MKHDFEQLGATRFQEFCQALLLKEFPDLACLPVGMPDGGRDGITRRLISGDPQKTQVFQVKYVEQPDYLSDATEWARSIVEGELEKVTRLAERGAERYWLLTNAPASSHLDTGSHDKVQRVLDELLPIPGQCLWRADLDRRLENQWSLKWAYPDLMTGTDYLRALVESRLSEHIDRRTRALRAFLADEYGRDREVRFKQADVQDELLDAFVDVPAEASRGPTHGRLQSLQANLMRLAPSSDAGPLFQPRRASPGGSSVLLDGRVQDHTPRLVIEGAPGQGKSTLLQYVCQVHRMRLLERADDVDRLPEQHKSSPLRVPFKVDLRELAQWLSGTSPFSPEAEPPKPEDRTLEGFLAALVRRRAGGVEFSVDDLHAVLATGPTLIALDGLDEVVDVGDRGEIVTSIERAVERLKAVADSLQVVVTSRPASFTAARLPTSAFNYLRLADLTPQLIDQYRDQWAGARALSDHEATDLAAVLSEKLNHPHFRDLARNPMQLAILLSLMHRKGPALPDQRTELYHSYMDHFLDREASKSTAVRDHRQALLLLHGHLAWLLHAEAEKSPRAGGRISRDVLLSTSRAFLETQDCGPELFEDLEGRALDRFGALVSRVEGTFEFEVQPLREYFAAFYLYNTAPHSRPGRERAGTRMQRFDALVRRPFWLNVVRFYAGFYGAGELSSLADGLEDLAADALFSVTALPRTVTVQLLKDRTFTQAPRARSRVIKLVTAGVGARHAGTGEGAFFRGHFDQQQFILPERNGAVELRQAALGALDSGVPAARAQAVARLARGNGPATEVAAWWLEIAKEKPDSGLDDWFKIARYLNVLTEMSKNDLQEILDGSPPTDERCHALLACGVWDWFDVEPDWAKAAEDYVLKTSELWLPPQPAGPIHPLLVLARTAGADQDVAQVETPFYSPRAPEWTLASEAWPPHYDGIRKIAQLYDRIRPGIGASWSRNVEPWDELVELGREVWGERRAWDRLVVIASGIRDRRDRGAGHHDLADGDRSLCKRARHARHRGHAVKWWDAALSPGHERADRLRAIALWACWADQNTIAATEPLAGRLIQNLDTDEMQWILDTVNASQQMFNHTGRPARRLRGIFPGGVTHPRVLAALIPRLVRKDIQRVRRDALALVEERDFTVIPSLLLADVDPPALNPDSWGEVLRVLRLANATNLGEFPPLLGRLAARRLPPAVAQNVIDDAESYPLDLVGHAEQSLLRTAITKTSAVGATAKQEGWFSSAI